MSELIVSSSGTSSAYFQSDTGETQPCWTRIPPLDARFNLRNQPPGLGQCFLGRVDGPVELALVDLAYHPTHLRPGSHAEGQDVAAPQQRF